MLNELLPSGLRGMVLAALMAAIISSLDSAMNSISTLVVCDFVLPFTPALTFGILSKRVTAVGAGVSVLVGTLIACVFMADELMGAETGRYWFPWLHTTSKEPPSIGVGSGKPSPAFLTGDSSSPL